MTYPVSVLDFVIAFANPDEARSRVVLLVGSLIGVCLFAGAVILLVRRRMFAHDHPSADQGSLLDQLRSMRDRGELSEDEFNQAKVAMHAKLKASIADGLGRPGSQKRAKHPDNPIPGSGVRTKDVPPGSTQP